MQSHHPRLNCLIASVLVGALLGACAVPAAEPAELTQPATTPSQPGGQGAATEAPVGATFAPQGTPPGFPTIVIESVVTDPLVISLLAGLQQRGFPTELQDASRVEQLQDAPGQSYRLGDGWLFVHVYAQAQTAQATAAGLAGSLAQSSFDWVAPPHFFQCDRLIVLYLGYDEAAAGTLSQLCAPPFYTSSFSMSPAPTPTPAIPLSAVPTFAPSTPTPPPSFTGFTAEVDLDVFSGRPNPTWPLSDAQVDAFQQKVAALSTAAAQPYPGRLGYRGLVVILTSKPGGQLPVTWRVWGGVAQITRGTAVAYYADPQQALESWLLQSGQPFLPADLFATVQADMASHPPPSAYPLEIHQTFSTGLTVDEYALAGEPTLDPLNFTTVQSTRADIVARHFKDGGAVPFYNSGFDAQGSYRSTDWRGQTLTAHEIYTNATPGIINVLLGNQLLYTLPIGHGGPLNALQQLLTIDDHWFLEVLQATYGNDPLTQNGTVTTTGEIVEDGIMLNARDGAEQLFGLQLLHGQPFYFYQQAGHIGAVYDRHTLPLGYDSVSHYGCCSYAQLNPQPRANMVSFFAQKGGVWFYVEIGDY